MNKLSCFKAYDIRGKLGDELNEDIAYRIGRAYGEFIKPKQVVVGGDVRLTSEILKNALSEGLMDAGTDVIDLGMTGTEEIYFATSYLKVDGGIEVTASHNPIDFNGMKLIREESKPISSDTGLKDIQKLAESNNFPKVKRKGTIIKASCMDVYIEHLISYIDIKTLKPLKLVVNAGNGSAGPVIDNLENKFKKLKIPIEFIKINHKPDGNFPNGIPNPLLPENRKDTKEAVLKYQANMGIAWDGDFDRCFLFDEDGNFIEGYYIVGLLAKTFCEKELNVKIIHDPRLTWNTIDIVNNNGGTPIQSKTGHAFIKERMRKEDAIYGGEMSAHYYFRDFFYCDSGMIPWLLIIELISKKNQTLKQLIDKQITNFPCSGEINFQVQNVKSSIDIIKANFLSNSISTDTTDGLSMSFSDWRFNLRGSNTEPLLRLNIESRNNKVLLLEKTKEISLLLKNHL